MPTDWKAVPDFLFFLCQAKQSLFYRQLNTAHFGLFNNKDNKYPDSKPPKNIYFLLFNKYNTNQVLALFNSLFAKVNVSTTIWNSKSCLLLFYSHIMLLALKK